MFDVQEKPRMIEASYLVGVYFNEKEKNEAQELLIELKDLVKSLGVNVIGSKLAKVRKINAGYFLGMGKLEEILDEAKSLNADCIVFDNDLTPAQQRNWEKTTGLCVIDRQEVILDIFSKRAFTREARLQVDLARMEYSIPRLTRMWTHLHRQGGGIGGRGEGESQLEIDKRLARKKIEKLKKQLEEVRKQRTTRRKERERNDTPHAAIVGYTNAGKSSLLNTLTNSNILTEDKLFATLDPTTRKMSTADGQNILLTDTVGFIRKLPHKLIESFKATLEEALLADLLIHVLDGSSKNIFQFYQTTLDVLEEINVNTNKSIIVINKFDLIENNIEIIQTIKSKLPDAIFISANENIGIENLKNKINDFFTNNVSRLDLRIPFSRQDLTTFLHKNCKILSEEYDNESAIITSIIQKKYLYLFKEYIFDNKTTTST